MAAECLAGGLNKKPPPGTFLRKNTPKTCQELYSANCIFFELDSYVFYFLVPFIGGVAGRRDSTSPLVAQQPVPFFVIVTMASDTPRSFPQQKFSAGGFLWREAFCLERPSIRADRSRSDTQYCIRHGAKPEALE